MEMLERQLLQHTDKINNLLARYGVKFGIYKNNEFKEQLFPFDSIPRIIEHNEFEMLERGLKQRILGLYCCRCSFGYLFGEEDRQRRCSTGRFYICFFGLHGGM